MAELFFYNREFCYIIDEKMNINIDKIDYNSKELGQTAEFWLKWQMAQI